MRERWINPKYRLARDNHARAEADLTPVDQQFEHLGRRHDYAASRELDAVRPKLDALYTARDRWAREMGVEEEVEQVVNPLIDLLDQKRGQLHARFEAITSRVDTISDAEFLSFHAENREVERLRMTVFGVTNLPEYAREWDAVLALKSFWFDLNRERTRLFDRLLAAGMRPRHAAAPWAADLQRLSVLRASHSKEDMTHAR
jgi:hypothetical protein